ncbi:MAG: 50S ribosomal protein L21 [Pelagibacterales bacterium]|nr:50S ribosomal protein L21 [Pelagibacterales bacterium]
MFAIIETGGKQYRVAPNERITVEKIEGEVGSKITLNDVLFFQNEKSEATFGSPLIKGAQVEAEIVKTYKGQKVIIFKKRRRQNSRRKQGHRQFRTEIKILSIKA